MLIFAGLIVLGCSLTGAARAASLTPSLIALLGLAMFALGVSAPA